MKKLSLLFAAVVASFAIAGCSSVQTATSFNGQKIADGTAVAHISATTHGLYLLSIPLITGSETSLSFPTLLTDTVSPACLSRMVTAEAQKRGASRVSDLVTQGNSAGFIFYYRFATASGNALK